MTEPTQEQVEKVAETIFITSRPDYAWPNTSERAREQSRQVARWHLAKLSALETVMSAVLNYLKDCADEGTVPDAKTVKGIEADWEKVRK